MAYDSKCKAWSCVLVIYLLILFFQKVKWSITQSPQVVSWTFCFSQVGYEVLLFFVYKDGSLHGYCLDQETSGKCEAITIEFGMWYFRGTMNFKSKMSHIIYLFRMFILKYFSNYLYDLYFY